MPVAGFRKGDRVLTPAGKRGVVFRIKSRNPEVVVVDYADGERGTFRNTFRAGALRFDGRDPR